MFGGTDSLYKRLSYRSDGLIRTNRPVFPLLFANYGNRTRTVRRAIREYRMYRKITNTRVLVSVSKTRFQRRASYRNRLRYWTTKK